MNWGKHPKPLAHLLREHLVAVNMKRESSKEAFVIQMNVAAHTGFTIALQTNGEKSQSKPVKMQNVFAG